MKSFLLLFLVLPCMAWCQDYSYTHYSITEGLPSAEVYQVFQDKEDFIWFATDNGVTRFDGTEFQSFHARQGLPDPVVFGFSEDSKGRIWFRSYSGKLSWFEKGMVFKYPYNDTIAALCKKSLLHSIYVDSLDQVWLGAGEFYGSITSTGKVTLHQNPDHELYYKSIGPGFITGMYWPSSLVNKAVINGHVFPMDLQDHTYDNQTINATQWKGHLYISRANAVYKYDGKTLEEVIHSADHVISLSVDREDRLWVGYRESGVECYRSEKMDKPLTLDFLKTKSVSKVLEDNQKGFWFTTLQSGVYYIPEFSFRNYDLPVNTKVISTQVFRSQTLFGSNAGSMALVDNKTTAVKHETKLAGETMMNAFVDSRKVIWASTNRTGYRLDTALNVLGNFQVQHDLFERHDTVYGLSRGRIVKYLLNGDKVGVLQLATIHRSMINTPPFVLMSGRTGVDVYDANFKFIRTLESLKNYKISKLLDLNDSVILVSTIGSGYVVLAKPSWKIIARSEGKSFVGDNIYSSILVDSMVWLGTEKGIAITSLHSLIRKSPDFKFLDKQGGLISNNITMLAYASPDVWAFTDRGFTIIPKNIAPASASPPKFYLKNILINDQPADLSPNTDLPFLSNSIQINFGFISFKNQNILLRSRLTRTGEWHYSEDRSLKFYSLAPGNYHFQLQYSTDMAHWQNASAELPFTILQPWWRTSWFQAVVIAVIILVVFLIFGSQLTALRHRNERLNIQNETKKNYLQAEIETLERERSRIAKDLHDGIGMNLTVLKLYLHDLLKKYHEPESAQVEEQLKSTIQEIRSIVHNLTPSGIALFGLAESVKDYIDRTTGNLSVKIELFSAGKKIMEPRISLFSFRIIQELLSNSLKHSRATRITIRINVFDGMLNIIFEDNGIGFNPDTCKYGAGLMNIQARLEALDGSFEFSSKSGGVLYIINVPLPSAMGTHFRIPENMNLN